MFFLFLHFLEDSASSLSFPSTPGRGRGRGRGRGSRGGSTPGSSTRGGPRAPRLSRGASAVAKAIALNRPKGVGGLKHTPDPSRLKGLITPVSNRSFKIKTFKHSSNIQFSN